MRALLLLALLAPLAHAQEAPEGVVLLTDPAGDAVEAGPAPLLEDNCPVQCPPLPPGAGVPAPPALDLLEVRLRETPQELVVTFVVASLDEALTGLVTDDGAGRGTELDACWSRGNTPCAEGARFSARRNAGQTFLYANYGYRDDACNTRALCGWGVPVSFTFGTPGEVHLHVPRGLAPTPLDAGSSILDGSATVSRLTTSPALLDVPEGPPVLSEDTATLVDPAGGADPYVLELPRAPGLPFAEPRAGTGPGLLVGGDPTGGQDAEADLLELAVVETPATLTFSFAFAGVAEAPVDQRLRMEWAFQGARYHVAEIVVQERQRTLISYACNPSDTVGCSDQEPVPATYEVVPGAPGFVNITYLRPDIGSPDVGAQTSRIVAFVATGAARAAGTSTEGDGTGLLPPVVLRMATRSAPVPPGTYRLDDASSDARIPSLAEAPDASGAEVTHAEAQALPDGSTRLALGLRDPSRTAIPFGYTALVRGIAIEEDGRTTLVAAHRDASRERYFCAADTLVLPAEKRVPPEDAWRDVPATVGSEPGGGNITFLVPPECLAPSENGRAVRRMAAASYLVRQDGVGGEEVVLVDEVVGAEAFVLALGAEAPVPVAAERPLPWALFVGGGLLLALALVAVPLVLLRGRSAPVVLPAPGALFMGRYLVDREIGRGGFGAVWLATHTKLGRKVVIKQLQPGWAADEKAVERFRREARLLAKLDHPHVVKVYDAEEMQGQAFIVMEYVEGGTLGELRPKPVALPALARIGAELLDALSAIHAAGVVHGDLKPDNVLLAADRTVRVADFGIARPAETGAMRTMAYGVGEPVGTPLFMAPEQLEGAAPMPASDLYAAAAVVHHVATGRLLFTPAPMDIESARLAHARGAPDAGEGILHPALVAWIRRGLARDPRDRFASADEMLEAWHAAVGIAREA